MAVGVNSIVNRVDLIREVSLKLFLEKGYDGTSIRDIAAQPQINSATLYHYFPSKQDILRNVISTQWHEVFRELGRRMAEVRGSWTGRLYAFVQFHSEWHCLHRDEVRILSSESRSLQGSHQAVGIAQRDKYEGMLRTILEQGNAAGEFHLKDIPVTSFAILQMLTGIADWYQSDGGLKAWEIGELFWDLVRAMVRVQPDAASLDLQPARC